MKNILKYIVLPIILLIVFIISLVQVNIHAGNYWLTWGGNRAWWQFESDSLYIYPSHDIHMQAGDSLYYNGVVVTSGSGGGGDVVKANVNVFTNNNFLQNGTYFTDSVKVTGALLLADSIKALKDVSFMEDLTVAGNILSLGDVTATNFWGDGVNISGLNGTNINAGLVAGQYGGTGVANTGKTITLGGNLTTSGAHATTLTTTGTTGVTLPTTGTLATLAGTETLTGKTIVNGSSGNTITGIKSGYFELIASAFNPTNATYYFGRGIPFTAAAITTAGSSRLYIPVDCTIKAIIISAYHNTPASSETTTYSIGVSGAYTTIGTGIFTTGSSYEITSNTAMSVAVTAGQYLEVRCAVPSMSTYPTNVVWTATVYVE